MENNCAFIGIHWVETRRKWVALAIENGSLMNKMESFPTHRRGHAGKSMADFVRLRRFGRLCSNDMMPRNRKKWRWRDLRACGEEFVEGLALDLLEKAKIWRNKREISSYYCS